MNTTMTADAAFWLFSQALKKKKEENSVPFGMTAKNRGLVTAGRFQWRCQCHNGKQCWNYCKNSYKKTTQNCFDVYFGLKKNMWEMLTALYTNIPETTVHAEEEKLEFKAKQMCG